MFNFKYEVELNDKGRPFINPVEGTEKEMGFVEHKFMALEMTRAYVTNVIQSHLKNPEKHPLTQDDLERLQFLENEVTRVGNVFASVIKEQFELLGIADRLINNNFDAAVSTIDELHGLNYNGFFYDDRLFTRKEGLKIKILKTGQVFELQGGIDNEHWKEI